MSSLSASVRFFAPTIPHKLLFPRTLFLYSRPLSSSSSSSSSISFTRLPRSPLPIKSQLQQQDSPQPSLELTHLPKKLQDIITLFQSVQDPKAKYHQLLHYGSKLQPLDLRYKTDEHRVRGCVSQVWVRAFADPDDPSTVRFEADSDSALTKGLAALLVMGLSGSLASVIARVPPEFVQLLGLRQSLTPSRNNGFLNMLKLMQQKALELNKEGGDPAADGRLDGDLGGYVMPDKDFSVNGTGESAKEKVLAEKESNLVVNGGSQVDRSGSSSDAVSEVRAKEIDPSVLSRAVRIRTRLEKELRPLEMEVEDISYQHAGHAGVRGLSGGETHFNIGVVSKEFEGKSMVKRHRLIYNLLQDELQTGLHALSIVAKAPSEVSPK